MTTQKDLDKAKKLLEDAPICGYNLAYQGPCEVKVPIEGDRCEEHLGKFCVSCGDDAVRQCSSAGSFVCGAPLCNDCVHGNGGHHSKDGVDKTRSMRKQNARMKKLFQHIIQEDDGIGGENSRAIALHLIGEQCKKELEAFERGEVLEEEF